MGRKRVVIVVEPEKTVSWDHSKLGGNYDMGKTNG